MLLARLCIAALTKGLPGVLTFNVGIIVLHAGLQGWEERLKISDRAHIGE